MKKLFFISLCTLVTFGLSAQVTVTIGTGTLQNGTTSYPAPYGNFYWGAKHQFIIPASELYAAGIPGNIISGLAFDVVTPAGIPLENFEIKMGETNQSSLTTWVNGLTTVYSVANFTEVTGWNNHVFSSQFVWNGADNIIIETCFNNSSWTDNAIVNQSTTTYNSTLYYNGDNATVCTSPSFINTSAQRPNMQLSVIPASNDDIDLGVVSVLSPVDGCGSSTNDFVIANIVNFGNNDTSNINVSYILDGGSPVTELITSIIPSHTSYAHTFSTSLSLVPGTHTFDVYTSLAQDTSITNDTSSITVTTNLFGSPYIFLSDSCLYFDSVIVNSPVYQNLQIFNRGCDTLRISNILSSNADFTVDNITNGTILPGDTLDVVITFDASVLGSISSNLTVQSNLPDTVLCLEGFGSNIISDFLPSTQNPCTAAFQFEDLSLGVPTSWSWDFGDGNSSSNQNPFHLYSSVGSYVVKLIVCNSTGCDTSQTTVNSTFLLDYVVNTSGDLTTTTPTSFEVSGNNIIATIWDFGDQSSLPGLNVEHTYSAPGSYYISVNVLTGDPCSFDIYDTVVIEQGIIGVNEFESLNLEVYPNPTNGEFGLTMHGINEGVDLEIFNSLGKVVYSISNVLLNNYKIELKDHAGIYLLRVSKDSEPIAEKQIVVIK